MKITQKEWLEAQEFEKAWWNTARNTYGEETKQLFCAEKMGLDIRKIGFATWIDAHNKSVCDIGGGVCSLLLKTQNVITPLVVEPMKLAGWAYMRYLQNNIDVLIEPVEEAKLVGIYDEVWMYNVLQHTQNPDKIIRNAQKHSKLIRFFDWIDTPPHAGHPQTLKADHLDEMFNGRGRVIELNSDNWDGFGRCYFGVFPTKNYDGKFNQ